MGITVPIFLNRYSAKYKTLDLFIKSGYNIGDARWGASGAL